MKTRTWTTAPIRVYVDTSVFGGAFDRDFSWASRAFFAGIRAGRFLPVVSPTVVAEIHNAPPRVQRLFAATLRAAETTGTTPAALALRDAYLRAGVVAPRWAPDALHVAIATTAGCPVIVSWNFKHIVNFRRIPLYNAVNKANGLGEIGIFTPLEVIDDEDETL